MASLSSFPNGRAPWVFPLARRWRFFQAASLSAVLLACFAAFGQVPSSNILARAQRIYTAAVAARQANPQELQAACDFARACFDLAELVQSDTNRVALGRQGSDAARWAATRSPTNAQAHYCLALNLGEVARVKRMSALKIVSEMESRFETARKWDETLDYAGPDRCLGLLYRDAPGWPLSVGSRGKARRHLLRAFELSPDFPENRLNLVESFLKWDERPRAIQEAAAFEKALSAARTSFHGEAWEADWADWNQRWEEVRAKLGESGPGGSKGAGAHMRP